MKILASRRSLLTLLATATAAGAAAGTAPAAARAAASTDTYDSNTDLYAQPGLTEGDQYGRRFRRHATFDDDLVTAATFPQVAIIAPHGGGIEPGTSELCVAIAGYHPESFATDGPVYDYWMFEGLLGTGDAMSNSELHVTSTHCDDPVAESLCGGARRVISLHGCKPTDATGLVPPLAQSAAVLVGGLDTVLKQRLIAAYAAAGIHARDAAGTDLAGEHPDNIVNRNLSGAGAQLELTTPLRTAMFGINTRADRRKTTTEVFKKFVAATRAAIAAA